jgi:hypothetical protein
MIPTFILLAMIWTGGQERLIERAAFMQGCWEQRSGARLVEEQWLKPRAGNMLGMSRTVRGDTLVEYEFIRIYERGHTLVYAAQPSGQPAAEFTATSIADDVIIFRNPAHDFPQRISYRLRGDSLLARIEGERNGQPRAVDFPYVRVRCS